MKLKKTKFTDLAAWGLSLAANRNLKGPSYILRHVRDRLKRGHGGLPAMKLASDTIERNGHLLLRGVKALPLRF